MDILEEVEKFFGIENCPPAGKTFIMPDGYFLNMKQLASHSAVEGWLIKQGLPRERFAFLDSGSPTLSCLGCFRCNMNRAYVILPDCEFPSDEAQNSLLLWLDKLANTSSLVTVVTPKGKQVRYDFSEYLPDDIIDKIDRFYTSGILYEKQIEMVRANDARYIRRPAGNKLELGPGDKNLRLLNEQKFRSICDKEDLSYVRDIEENYREIDLGELDNHTTARLSEYIQMVNKQFRYVTLYLDAAGSHVLVSIGLLDVSELGNMNARDTLLHNYWAYFADSDIENRRLYSNIKYKVRGEVEKAKKVIQEIKN